MVNGQIAQGMDAAEVEYLLDVLVEEIGKGDVVPIVGIDVLYIDKEGESLDLVSYLVAELEKIYFERKRKTFDYDSHNCVLSFEKLNHIHSIVAKNKWPFYTYVEAIIRNIEPYIQTEYLEKLAKIKKFKLFINASPTSQLENAVRTHREIISNTIDVFSLDITYSPPQDIKIDSLINSISPAKSPKYLKKTIVYNLFGKFQWKNGFTVVDDDMLELIHVISNNRSHLKTLYELLTASSLLFIGCNFPDWLLRFFMRMFSPTRLSSNSGVYTVADVMNGTDKNRAIFIKNSEIKYFELDGNEFIDRLFARLERDEPSWIRNNADVNYIFLSYVTDNRSKVLDIFQKLDENNCDAYLDIKRIDYGENITDDVRKGIDNCKIFMPVISNETNSTATLNRYFRKEWEYILDLHQVKNPNNDINKSPVIIPVFLDAINSNDVMKTTPSKFFELKYLGLDFGENIFDDFLKRIKEILNVK
jgi:hypothetical protein